MSRPMALAITVAVACAVLLGLTVGWAVTR